MKGAKALYSSDNTRWRTPDSVFAAVERLAGQFHIDLCADAETRIVKNFIGPGANFAAPELQDARNVKQIGPVVDALRLWCNPPYGRDIGSFIEACKLYARNYQCDVWALVLARTDTRWWHDHVMGSAAELRFRKGRIRFNHPDGTPGAASCPAPSVLIRWPRGFEPDVPNILPWPTE